MQVIRGPEHCPRPAEGTAVAIGVFDGVHLGHQVVMGEARRIAAELGARSAVVTFDRHPASVVRPETAPRLLTDLDQRLERIAAAGIDHAVVIEFDAARSKEPPEDFVEEILVGCLRARAVVVGENFKFGHQARGNVELLQRLGRQHGFEVDGLDLLASGASAARPVSSTAIREALADGDLQAANRMLGRPHEVRGTVIRGDGRGGTELGFPTANVAVPSEICLPADGVYAGWYVTPDGTSHRAAIAVGRRPQFDDDQPRRIVEAHVLDLDADLYGQPARVRFVARLRGQERYPSVEELVEQMQRDVEATRAALVEEPA